MITMTDILPKQLGISQPVWDLYKHYALEMISRACKEGHLRVARWVMATYELPFGAAKYSHDKNYIYSVLRNVIHNKHLYMLQWVNSSLGITSCDIVAVYQQFVALDGWSRHYPNDAIRELYIRQWMYVTHKVVTNKTCYSWSRKEYHKIWYRSWQATVVAQSAHLKPYLLCDVLRRMTRF